MTDAGMQERLIAYFTAEKNESVVFVVVGVVALTAAVVLFRGASAYRGMILPLALIGAIQLAVGGSIFLRTDHQMITLSARLAEDPAALRREETARMDKVMASFRIIEIVEVIVIVAGLVLVLFRRRGSRLRAAGIGCMAQGSIMLVLDLFAEAHGRDYLTALARLW